MNFSIHKQKKWLGWLAWKLKYTASISTFELAYLQPHWVKRKPVFNFIDCTFIGLFVGLLCFFYMLPYRFIKNESIDLLNMLHVSLIIASFIFVVVGISKILKFYFKNDHKIITKEILEFNSLKKIDINLIKQTLSLYFINSLIYSLTVGLLFGIVLWLSDTEGKLTFFGSYTELIIMSTVLFCLFGAFFGLLSSLVNIFFVANSFPKINSPYKRLLAQFWRDTFQTIFIFFISFILLHYFSDSHLRGEKLLEYLSFGILIGLMISIVLSPIFKHFSVRLSLIIENTIPFNLVAFLNSVSKNSGLLISYGGQWRFRHQLILDSLANEFEENHPNLLSKKRSKKNKSYSKY